MKHVRTLGLWDNPYIPGLSQDIGTRPKTLRSRDCSGTLRPLIKTNIIFEHVRILGLWDSPNVPGPGDSAKYPKIPELSHVS